jgi:hypothetical protein
MLGDQQPDRLQKGGASDDPDGHGGMNAATAGVNVPQGLQA